MRFAKMFRILWVRFPNGREFLNEVGRLAMSELAVALLVYQCESVNLASHTQIKTLT